MQYQKPEDDKVRSAKWYLPVAAVAAVVLAYLVGTYVINNRQPDLAANPADQSAATGGSSGETGRNTIQNDPNAKSNPGAEPAPAKAPNTNPDAGDSKASP